MKNARPHIEPYWSEAVADVAEILCVLPVPPVVVEHEPPAPRLTLIKGRGERAVSA